MTNTHTLPERHAPQSLKSKLVLSYLLVIFGTILVLSVAVTMTVQNYFYQYQMGVTSETANWLAQTIVRTYQYNGSNWSSIPQRMLLFDNLPSGAILDITDEHSNSQSCQLQNYDEHVVNDICGSTTIKNIVAQVLKTGQSASGQTAQPESNDQIIYTCEPLKYGAQTVGTLFYAQPFSSGSPLQQGIISHVSTTIWLSGFAIAIIAGICAYLLIRGLVQPLNTMTVAVERMKRGQYTGRVPEPAAQDELGLLAQTFNEMADKIEADVNELRQQDQMRRDLIANIAHDLATPLTAIQGLSEALADDVVSDPVTRQETAQRIGREVQRLRRMVAEVRQMTQVEAGQIRMDLAPLDLHTLVDETVTVIQPECEQMGITIQNLLPASTPLVEADSDRITQVLLNLLDNARRHTAANGKIQISSQQQPERLLVTVSDTGVGISAEDLPHIFERFYRADRSRKAQAGSGSGLGLAIVKAIITAHGGKVWAESAPGQGTHIHFTLPYAKAEQQQSSDITIPQSTRA